MSQSIKKAVQNALLLPRKNKYEKDYQRLLKAYEEKRSKIEEYVSLPEVCDETSKIIVTPDVDFFCEMLKDNSFDEDVFYFLFDDKFYKPKAESERLLYEFIKIHPDALILYGDEDYLDMSRFFKPEFSPETLISYNYINPFAIKGSVLKKVLKDGGSYDFDWMAYFYGVLMEACNYLIKEKKETSIVHIPAVLSTGNFGSKGEFIEYVKTINSTTCFDVEKDCYISKDEFLSEALGIKEYEKNPGVSIIIPSKDNPDMLISCIDGLKDECSDNTEIIVVDNGSDGDNKNKIKNYLDNLNIKNQYIYDSYEFNYSKMNNIAAKAASGDVLLLLNDDIETKGAASGWIMKMAKKAMEEGIGCVGCKLLYPDWKIQHVGIAGGVDGPAHIYMGEEDKNDTGHGENIFNRNVLAVTGAALAVKRDLYEECGGLFEELKVGYNDVDLCMSLYEKGFRNILFNDIFLIHHESVSRGMDAKSRVKSERLKNEKEILKTRHRELMISDPYMGGCEDFKLAVEEEWDEKAEISFGQFITKKASDDEGWVYSSFEKLEVSKSNEGNTILTAKGFALVPGIDNMRFDFELILEKDDAQFVIPIKRTLRTDLAGRFNGTDNTVLCGIDLRADISELKNGKYDIKIYAKDHGNVREIITDTSLSITV